VRGGGVYAAFAEEQQMASELDAIAEVEIAASTPLLPALAPATNEAPS
jgi:hypothetical protein